MRIVEPKVEIITPINGEEILKHIEKVGRVCYKSESNIDDSSAEKFVSGINSTLATIILYGVCFINVPFPPKPLIFTVATTFLSNPYGSIVFFSLSVSILIIILL